MADIYNDKTYLLNNPAWHEEDSPFKANKIEELLKRNAIAFESVCEVGCGSGEILVQLSYLFPSIKKLIGFDISRDAFEIAKTKKPAK